jgi:hyperosmotically inducible protein
MLVELHQSHHLRMPPAFRFPSVFSTRVGTKPGTSFAFPAAEGFEIMIRLPLFLMTAALMIPVGLSAKTTRTLPEEVQHQLAMLPHYNVFDDLAFKVDGTTVILTGQVTRPVVKEDAQYAVRHVEGVTSVVNNIEVLPLSPTDDQLRMAVYRAVYGAPSLSDRYGFQASPSIHIIVKNGVVKLEGVVANKMDRQIAGMRAQNVFGSFQVVNDLQIGS